MKYYSSIAAVVAILSLSGCATLNNYVSHPDIDPGRLLASASGYKIVGYAEGHAKATYILGIGGMSDRSREANALMDMYENARLKSNQAIINVLSRRQDTFIVLPIYWRRQFVTSGTIIEYTDWDNNDQSTYVEDDTPSVSEIVSESEIKKMSSSKRRKLQMKLQMELFDDLDYLSEANDEQVRLRLPDVKAKIELYKQLCSQSGSTGYVDFDERLKVIEARM